MKKTVEAAGRRFTFDTQQNTVTVACGGRVWCPQAEFRPFLTVADKKGAAPQKLFFADACAVRCEDYSTGVAEGILTTYTGWLLDGRRTALQIATLTWVHRTSGRLYFELIPLREPRALQVEQVCWPAPWAWARDAGAYTLLPILYGMMIPGDYAHTIEEVGHPRFCTAWLNMSWYGQIERGRGCMTTVDTPWDAGLSYCHPADGPTQVQLRWDETLGKIGYRRVAHCDFFAACDYVAMCKAYRRYRQERGEVVTLAQKAAQNAQIRRLAGSPVIHTWIHYDVKPEAVIYDRQHPERNFRSTTFDWRADAVRALSAQGVKKAYLHLDGWGRDGYDREHPDVLPPCERAGGAAAMRRLQQACRDSGFLFALHDQYRDYYYDAATFDPQNAVTDASGAHPHECTWNGGDQSILCSALAQHYVERNYAGLHDLGIDPDGVYLDVFSTVDLDECGDPMHRVTRRECIGYRRRCMALLAARGMIVSSESPVDAFLPDMVLCHHFPWVDAPFSPGCARSVPLFGLAFHDCLIAPWPMHDEGDAQTVMPARFLYALLGGGPGYLEIDADRPQQEKIAVLSRLHEKVMYSEMLSHEFLDDTGKRQRTVFDGGVTVTVDFEANTYTVEGL